MRALRFFHARLSARSATVCAFIWLTLLFALALFFFGDAGGQFRYLNL